MFHLVPLHGNTSLRYLQEITPLAAEAIVALQWDEDDGAAREIVLSIWTYDGTTLEFVVFVDSLVSLLIHFLCVKMCYHTAVHLKHPSTSSFFFLFCCVSTTDVDP